VAILDQDDIWLPHKLQCDVDLLDNHSQIDLAFSGYQMIDEGGRPIGPAHIPPRVRFGFDDLFVDYHIGPTAAAVIRLSAATAAGSIDTSLQRYYDLEFFWRVSRLRQDNVAATRASLTQYRRHAGQLSANVEEMRKEWECVVEGVKKQSSVDPQSVARAHSNMNRYFAFLEYENERYLAGWGELTRSFRLAPVSFLLDHRNWLLAGGCLGGLVLPRNVRLAAERFAGDAYLRIATDSKIRSSTGLPVTGPRTSRYCFEWAAASCASSAF
jgi:hypothetical protein